MLGNFKFPDFTRVKILVVGDLMLDLYWSGNVSRISPEAPVPVVHIKDTKQCPGGASNVALNVASLGCKAILCGVLGRDIEALLKTLIYTDGWKAYDGLILNGYDHYRYHSKSEFLVASA